MRSCDTDLVARKALYSREKTHFRAAAPFTPTWKTSLAENWGGGERSTNSANSSLQLYYQKPFQIPSPNAGHSVGQNSHKG